MRHRPFCFWFRFERHMIMKIWFAGRKALAMAAVLALSVGAVPVAQAQDGEVKQGGN